jgi:hypothetical protein
MFVAFFVPGMARECRKRARSVNAVVFESLNRGGRERLPDRVVNEMRQLRETAPPAICGRKRDHGKRSGQQKNCYGVPPNEWSARKMHGAFQPLLCHRRPFCESAVRQNCERNVQLGCCRLQRKAPAQVAARRRGTVEDSASVRGVFSLAGNKSRRASPRACCAIRRSTGPVRSWAERDSTKSPVRQRHFLHI